MNRWRQGGGGLEKDEKKEEDLGKWIGKGMAIRGVERMI